MKSNCSCERHQKNLRNDAGARQVKAAQAVGHRPSGHALYFIVAFLMPLGIATRISRGRIFWEDELLGWMMLQDPSWRHVLNGWLKGVDGGGILFYLTGRLWFQIFGPSVLSFRLYTAAGFGLAFALIFAAGRRFYRPGIIGFAILLVWFGSPIPVQAISQGRFYGLLMATNAVTIYLFLRMANTARVPARFYVFIFLAQTCLVMSHILGIFYSSVLLLAMVFLDVSRRMWRPGLYLAALLPDLLLIPCLPAIRASAAVGRPHFWSSQPTFLQFSEIYSGFSLKLGGCLFFALLILALCSKTWTMRRLKIFEPARRPIYFYTAAIFLLPLLFFFAGFFGPSLCVSRYLFPVSVGTIFVVAEIVTLFRPALPGWVRDRATASAILFLALTLILAYDTLYLAHYNAGTRKDYTEALTARLPKDLPTVCEDAFAFTELVSTKRDPAVHFIFLLDWKNAISDQAPRVEVTQYHLMQNWKIQGYFSKWIQDRDTFLRETSSFYTVSFSDVLQTIPYRPAVNVERYPQIGNPLHQELARTPGYRVILKQVISLPEVTAKVWWICRIGSKQCSE
jgi:hypothetical protein